MTALALKIADYTPQQQPHLRIVSMPTEVTYVGDLFETPKQRHPQEECIAEIYRVKGIGKDDGVYAIPINREPREVHTAFLSTAKRITNPLPKRDWSRPLFGDAIFGLNEVELEPKADSEVLDLREKPELHDAIVNRMREARSARLELK